MYPENNSLWENAARRSFLPALILVANSFTWYTITSMLFEQIVDELNLFEHETFAALSFYYLAIGFSVVLGATFVRSRRRLLLFWILMGTASSSSLLLIGCYLPISAYLVALFVGISIGVGLPSCLAYFIDATSIDNRGMLGGIAWCITSLGMFLFMIGMSILSYFSIILALIIFRFLALIIFSVTSKKAKAPFKEQAIPSYFMILGSKRLILYLLSWIMFCLVNWMELPIIENVFGQELFALSGLIEFTLSGVFALLAGLFSDKIGRKRVIVAGFVFLGIGYAVLGLFLHLQIAWYIYMVLDGVAWGIFAVVFFMVLWGDLAENAQKERFYLIGGLPYLLAGYLSVLVKPYVLSIQPNTLFSLASLFLFLAVLPLLYVHETLPEKKIQERELKDYIEKAKKIRGKHP